MPASTSLKARRLLTRSRVSAPGSLFMRSSATRWRISPRVGRLNGMVELPPSPAVVTLQEHGAVAPDHDIDIEPARRLRVPRGRDLDRVRHVVVEHPLQRFAAIVLGAAPHLFGLLL